MSASQPRTGLGLNGDDPGVISEYNTGSHADIVADLDAALTMLALSGTSTTSMDNLTGLLNQTQLTPLVRQPPPPLPNMVFHNRQTFPIDGYPETLMPHLLWQIVYGELSFPEAIVSLLRLGIDLSFEDLPLIRFRLSYWVATTRHVRSVKTQAALILRIEETFESNSLCTLALICGVEGIAEPEREGACQSERIRPHLPHSEQQSFPHNEIANSDSVNVPEMSSNELSMDSVHMDQDEAE